MTKTLSRILAIFLLVCLSQSYADTLKIEVSGISNPLLQNVKTRLDVLQESQGQVLTPDAIHKLYELAPHEIKQGLQPYGFFNAKIRSQLLRNKTTWTARFYVYEGRPTRISKLDLNVSGEGETNAEIQKLLNNFPIHVGDTFNTDNYEKAKEKLLHTANNQGYIKASLTENKILINEQTQQASVIIHMNTGKRYYFGDVKFESNPYQKEFLQRFLKFNKNQPFSSEKLTEFQQELASSFYFQQVVVTPDFESADDSRVPVSINATPPKSQHYKFGIGYGSFTGPRLTAGASLRRLTDTGQHLDAQLRLSEVLSGFALKYYIPGHDPINDQWILGANYQKFAPEEGSSNSKTLSFGYDKKDNHFQNNISLNYLMERFQVNNEKTRNSELLYPAWNITYLNVDDLVNPKFGTSVNFKVQGGSRALLSSTSFVQAEIKGKYIFSPTDYSKVIARGDFGYTVVHDLDRLPLTMRFFAGGLNSVRGYKESWIGPGRYLEVASLEYQHHIVGNWTGAVFYDIGAASNEFNKHYRNGKGIGIIYSSVVGPIKVYIARGKKYGFEFSIGPEF